MAGTTVDEQGIVYDTLFNTMNIHGLDVAWDEMHPWHGASKIMVIEHFCKRSDAGKRSPDDFKGWVDAVHYHFVKNIEKAYFEDDILSLIDPKLPEYMNNLRENGMKVALNTGYPVKIQNAIMEKLNMHEFIDGFVSAETVGGRPKPFMIHRLMYDLGIDHVKDVAKAGDANADIGEGIKAGVGFNIGVLSGADDGPTLRNMGADVVVENITKISLGACCGQHDFEVDGVRKTPLYNVKVGGQSQGKVIKTPLW